MPGPKNRKTREKQVPEQGELPRKAWHSRAPLLPRPATEVGGDTEHNPLCALGELCGAVHSPLPGRERGRG